MTDYWSTSAMIEMFQVVMIIVDGCLLSVINLVDSSNCKLDYLVLSVLRL